MPFPHVDPIPLPAPVWLLKTLSLLTLTLHFVAVMLLIGGLVMVCLLNFRGTRKGQTEGSPAQDASLVIARRLPVVMTYVINLGVPPLLFAQLLYGRALYTSSDLIAVMWLSVVFILMLAYWLLYRVSDRISKGKTAWPFALSALLLSMGIAQIYSFNMTLMLRPEVWQEMYARTATGMQAPPHDPTVTPRWLFMLCGGLLFGGIGMLLLSLQRNLTEEVRGLLNRFGAAIAAIVALPQIFLAYQVFHTQAPAVQESLSRSLLCQIAALLYLLGALGAMAFAALQFFHRAPHRLLVIGSAVASFLSVTGAVIFRDGIRDFTLFSKGFDVWDRTVVPNWSVIGLFVALLVLGIGVVGWLIWVTLQAKSIEERVVS